MLGPTHDTIDSLGWHIKDNKSVIQCLEKDILKLYLDNKQDESTSMMKRSIFDLIGEKMKSPVLTEEFTQHGVRLDRAVQFGSANTDFATKIGDIDVALILMPIDKNHTRIPMSFLQIIHKHISLKDNAWPHTSVRLVKAKVPIIKLEINNYQVDLSVHIGNVPPTNYVVTRVFAAYHRFEPRLVPLCSFLKCWFQTVEKTCVRQSGFTRVLPNSYATMIMVVFFLRNVGLLPDVVEKYGKYLHPTFVNWESLDQNFEVPQEDVDEFKENKKTGEELNVGELFIMFMNFYTNIVKLDKHGFNLNTGVVEEKPKPDKKLRIVDRFDPFNPGRSVKDISVLEKLFSQALEIVREHTDEEGLLNKLMKMSVSGSIEEGENVPKTKKANAWARNRLNRFEQQRTLNMPPMNMGMGPVPPQPPGMPVYYGWPAPYLGEMPYHYPLPYQYYYMPPTFPPRRNGPR